MPTPFHISRNRGFENVRRPGASAVELPEAEDFAAYCARRLEEMHRARRGFRRGVSCPELARHRARFCAVLASDALISRMTAVFGFGPAPAESLGDQTFWRTAVRAEAVRRDCLAPQARLTEATIRRWLTSGNLSELRRRGRV